MTAHPFFKFIPVLLVWLALAAAASVKVIARCSAPIARTILQAIKP